MRTTVMIDDALFLEAKKRAVGAGISFSELISRSLRETLARKVEGASPFTMVTFGPEASESEPRTPSDFYSEIEREDEQSYRGPRGGG